MRSLARAIRLGVVLSFLSLILFVGLLELVGRRVAPFKFVPGLVRDIDHRNTPNGLDINADGIRCRTEASRFRKEDTNIILLGDSFTYGFGLADSLAFPQQMETIARAAHPERRINVANFGWISASPFLSMRLLEDVGAKYNPDVVVLCLDMTDFQEDMKYPRFLARKGAYRLLPICPITVVTFRKLFAPMPFLEPLHRALYGFPSRQFFPTSAPLEKTSRDLAESRYQIDAIAAYARHNLGARFVLVILPRSYQYSDRECPKNWERKEYEVLGRYSREPFRYFEGIRDEVDYPIHSLLPDFENCGVFPTCNVDDPHWNADGCRIAAEALHRYLEQDGVFE